MDEQFQGIITEIWKTEKEVQKLRNEVSLMREEVGLSGTYSLFSHIQNFHIELKQLFKKDYPKKLTNEMHREINDKINELFDIYLEKDIDFAYMYLTSGKLDEYGNLNNRLTAVKHVLQYPKLIEEAIKTKHNELLKLEHGIIKKIYEEMGDQLLESFSNTVNPLFFYFLLFKNWMTNEQFELLVQRIVGYKKTSYAQEVLKIVRDSKLRDQLTGLLVAAKLR